MGLAPSSGAMNWTGTVKDLLVLHARSLRALVPVFSDAGLGWREEDAYDQWDRVASSLFDALVADALAWACGRPEGISLLPYDMAVEDLRNHSFLVVRDSQLDPELIHVFNRLATSSSAFDSILVRTFDSRLRSHGESAAVYIEGCEVALDLYSAFNQRDRLDWIMVPK